MKLYLALLVTVGITFSSCKKDSDESSPNGSSTSTPISLLSGEQKGTPFTTGTISDFTLASNGSTTALLISNDVTGKIYAVELNDNNAGDAAANTISSTTNVSDFSEKIAAKMGITFNELRLKNIEVNPISKAVYILASNQQNTSRAMFKATKAGTIIEQLTLSNVNYSEITFSTTGHRINDMTWGDGKLFLSFNQAATLNGEVASVSSPFTNGTALTARKTTVYKTNWGGGYHTDAPLETMTYAEVNGTKRLMGITVCAPGFSFQTNEVVSSANVLEVKEYFNLNTQPAVKVFAVNQGGTTYLIEVHLNGRITRVGEKYIDGSQTAVNANATYLLRNNGSRIANGMNDTDVKIIKPAGSFSMAAKYSDTKIIVVSNAGELSLLDI